MLKYMEVFMSLTNHYPFATIPLNYNLTSFEDFLDFQTLSIHYNQIYKEFVDDLNFILSTEISLQKLTLDEILFNEKILSPFRRNDIIKYAGGVYNHQIVFRSITPNPIVSICPELKKAIENKYKTMRDFYLEFKKANLKTQFSDKTPRIQNPKPESKQLQLLWF